MSKKSIRFFNDREVRAVWDDTPTTVPVSSLNGLPIVIIA